jgi:hypothetical protein
MTKGIEAPAGSEHNGLIGIDQWQCQAAGGLVLRAFVAVFFHGKTLPHSSANNITKPNRGLWHLWSPNKSSGAAAASNLDGAEVEPPNQFNCSVDSLYT